MLHARAEWPLHAPAVRDARPLGDNPRDDYRANDTCPRSASAPSPTDAAHVPGRDHEEHDTGMSEPRPNPAQPVPPDEEPADRDEGETPEETLEPEETVTAAAAATPSAAGAAAEEKQASGGNGGRVSEPAPRRPGGPKGRAATPTAGQKSSATSTQGPTPAAGSGEIPYIDDPVSRAWVGVVVGLFAVVFLYAVLLGHGGVLTPVHSPSPLPTPAASVTTSAAPSVAPSAAASAAPASSTSPAASSAAGAATPAPSSGASAPSAIPTPSPS